MKANRNSTMTGNNLMLGSGPDGIPGMFATKAFNNNHSVAYISHLDANPHDQKISFKLSAARIIESENYMIRANKSIHRSWPTGNPYSDDCIRRDSVLVRWCYSVYAVGLFTDDASLLKIAGDLAWSCQMYVDRFLYDQEPMDLCKLYLFDLKSESWFKWRYRWHRVSSVPRPSDVYSVLGYEKANRAAKKAIEDLWY